MLGRVELHHGLLRILEVPNTTVVGIPSSFPAVGRFLGYLGNKTTNSNSMKKLTLEQNTVASGKYKRFVVTRASPPCFAAATSEGRRSEHEHEATIPVKSSHFCRKRTHPTPRKQVTLLYGQLRPVEWVVDRLLFLHVQYARSSTFSMSSRTLSASASEKFP